MKTNSHHSSHNNTQSGNAIVIILVAISLFAALSYAFSNTSRTSSSFISDEETRAYANEIIAYGSEVKQAVKRLQLRGCSDTEISFENTTITDYVNPNAPTDKSCHVYDISGGGLQYLESKKIFFTAITKGIQITGAGKDCANASCTELLLVIRLTPAVPSAAETANGDKMCQIINKKLGNDSTIKNIVWGDDTPGTAAATRFKGVYDLEKTINEALLYGKKSYCGKVNASIYSYHQILIAR